MICACFVVCCFVNVYRSWLLVPFVCCLLLLKLCVMCFCVDVMCVLLFWFRMCIMCVVLLSVVLVRMHIHMLWCLLVVVFVCIRNVFDALVGVFVWGLNVLSGCSVDRCVSFCLYIIVICYCVAVCCYCECK